MSFDVGLLPSVHVGTRQATDSVTCWCVRMQAGSKLASLCCQSPSCSLLYISLYPSAPYILVILPFWPENGLLLLLHQSFAASSWRLCCTCRQGQCNKATNSLLQSLPSWLSLKAALQRHTSTGLPPRCLPMCLELLWQQQVWENSRQLGLSPDGLTCREAGSKLIVAVSLLCPAGRHTGQK